MSSVSKTPVKPSVFPVLNSNTAPAIDTSDANAPADTNLQVPSLGLESDKKPVEISEERVGAIEEQSKDHDRRIAAKSAFIGASITLFVVTLAQILGELIKATPAFQTLKEWCGGFDFGGLINFARLIGRFFSQLF